MLSEAASAIATALLRIEHNEPRFRCSARFATSTDAMEFTFERHTDGRASVVSAHESSCCYWEQDTLVSEDRTEAPEPTVVMIWRYELTGGGSRLRATERIRGGGRDQDNVWEFKRQ